MMGPCVIWHFVRSALTLACMTTTAIDVVPPTQRTIGNYTAKEHDNRRIRYTVRRKGSRFVVCHLRRVCSRWRIDDLTPRLNEEYRSFGSLDDVLHHINEQGL